MYKIKVLFGFILVFLFVGCDLNNNSKPHYDNELLVMIYMAADNNLDQFAIEDINEMESVDLSGKKIKVIVLLDRSSNGEWSNTKMYEICNDNDLITINSKIIDTPFTNMESNTGDGRLLNDFVGYSIKNYNSFNSMLIIWNHGEGILGSCYDETSGDFLDLEELKNGVSDFNIGIIGFDACFMGLIEVGYELRNCCEYLVFSQDDEPSSGWCYSYLLEALKYSELDKITIVKTVVEGYEYNTLSALYTIKIVEITNKLNLLLSSLNSSQKELLKNKRGYVTEFNNKNQVDLLELFNVFSNKLEFIELKNSVEESIIYNTTSDGYIQCCGISIYYPAKFYDYNLHLYTKERLDFCKNSLWYNFVF